MNSLGIMKKSEELGNLMDWRQWSKKIPSIPFKSHWRVKVIPPFTGAMVRFQVFALADIEEKNGISVYLDCHDILGSYGEPYWEVFPYKDDTARVPIRNVDELVEIIDSALYDEVCRI